MSLSAGDLAYVRSKIGSAEPPSDADLDVAYDRLGTADAVVLEVLTGRRANLLALPLKRNIDGDVSVDATANLKALDAAIAEARGAVAGGGAGTLVVGSLVRSDRPR